MLGVLYIIDVTLSLVSHAASAMTVRKNNKKSHPTYILLTAEEQFSLTLILLNFSSLARLATGGQGKFSQAGRGVPSLGADYTPLLARLILPVAECLQRVDSAVGRLDKEIETFHRAFDSIQKQFERIHGMMDRIMDVMTLMSTRNRQEAAEDDASVKVCECGRPIPGRTRGEERPEISENANENDSESDTPGEQKVGDNQATCAPAKRCI
jgi:hypothetical protein